MLVHDRYLVHRDDGFWSRWAVAQSTMWSLGVVVFSLLLDYDLRFLQSVKNFSV
jgi:hypothetical protein